MDDFHAADFLALSPTERVKKCRSMADEAERLANEAPEHLKNFYAELARECAKTAAELEADIDRHPA